jgi:N utilization substance protein A
MRKDDAQMFIMKARVIAGWIEQEAIDEMIAQQASGEDAPELTEEERALLALGELGNTDDSEEALADELGIDLADLQTEGGDEEAVPEQ